MIVYFNEMSCLCTQTCSCLKGWNSPKMLCYALEISHKFTDFICLIFFHQTLKLLSAGSVGRRITTAKQHVVHICINSWECCRSTQIKCLYSSVIHDQQSQQSEAALSNIQHATAQQLKFVKMQQTVRYLKLQKPWCAIKVQWPGTKQPNCTN